MSLESVLQKAEALFRAGRKQAAIDLLEGHLETAQQDAQAANILGRLYVNSGKPHRAAYWLRRALEIRGEGQSRSVAWCADLDEGPTSADAAFFDEHGVDVADAEWEFTNCPDEFEAPPGAPPSGREQYLDSGHARSGDSPAFAHSLDSQSGEDSTSTSRSDETHESGAKQTYDDGPETGYIIGSDEPGLQAAAAHEADEAFVDDVETPGVDWEDFALFEDDDPGSESDIDGAAHFDRLTLEEKAMQVAANIALEAGWSKQAVPPLVEVLTFHKCHHKTVKAVTFLLVEREVTPEELSLLHELRNLWASGGYNRVYWGSEAIDGWPTLSWQIALELCRTLCCESGGEALLFIEDCFDDWSRSPALITSWPDFKRYLVYVLNHMILMGECWNQRMPAFIEYNLFSSEDRMDLPGCPLWVDLEGYELLAHQGPMERWMDG